MQAVFKSSNGLRTGSPVRVAGVDVGKVVDIAPRRGGHGGGDDGDQGRRAADPLRRDRAHPSAGVPRGRLLVALEPGSPRRARCPTTDASPSPRTALPVQFQRDALGVRRARAREHTRRCSMSCRALSDGGAAGSPRWRPSCEPLPRDLAWLGEAFRGTAPHDLSNIIGASARIDAALDTSPAESAGWSGIWRATAGAVSDPGQRARRGARPGLSDAARDGRKRCGRWTRRCRCWSARADRDARARGGAAARSARPGDAGRAGRAGRAGGGAAGRSARCEPR